MNVELKTPRTSLPENQGIRELGNWGIGELGNQEIWEFGNVNKVQIF